MRIDRVTGFAAATRPLGRPVAATLIGPRRMAQPAEVIESEEAQGIKKYMDEALRQLAGIEHNFSNLIVALGTRGAAEARRQVQAAVEMYQNQYNQITGVAR